MAGTLAGDRVLYFYGVVPERQPLPRHEGWAIDSIVHGGLAALVEAVPAAEFTGDALAKNLESPEWVARRVRRHHEVLESAAAQGTVIPARFCTLFSGAEAVSRSLAENEERFRRALERVAGRKEWGLKAFGDQAVLAGVAADNPEIRALEAAAAAVGPGQAYVLGRKREARLAELAAERMDEVADEILDLVARGARDLRSLPSGEGDGAGGKPVVVLNLAVLVDDADVDAFGRAVAEAAERFGEEGFTLVTSGPWPPYHFTGDPDAGEPAPDCGEGGVAR